MQIHLAFLANPVCTVSQDIPIFMIMINITVLTKVGSACSVPFTFPPLIDTNARVADDLECHIIVDPFPLIKPLHFG